MIDAHRHVWKLGRGDYDWPAGGSAQTFHGLVTP